MTGSTANVGDLIDRAMQSAAVNPAAVSLEEFAAGAGYSRFHFSRLFKQGVGMSPGQYLTARRIDEAKRLLLAGDDSIIDIAMGVGFDSLSSFSRRFKRSVGVAPGQLRALADRVDRRPPRPFAVPGDSPARVTVRLEVPAQVSLRGDPIVWVGWYPQPAPVGLPRAGILVRGQDSVRLPLCPGAPFLLGFAVPAHADPLDHLVPNEPMAAIHAGPILGPVSVGTTVDLCFAQVPRHGVPMLSALPVLCRG
ncbi:helix-turn-helix transcriptional regulator [uncultured Tessaracoccus sp.]|uniref:helix-turn-helix transcriptional regulator n=1 Tax=uncultured Tessaracoccus sp. TaxID=905023 RepID=UPI00260F2AD1|nr:helix-turn-helix transcriptional regulator [uncultured Tessaracoccus sp.]